MKSFNAKTFTILLFAILINSSCSKSNDDLEPDPQGNDFDTLSLPGSFQQNILLEGFSGLWCGYCPPMELRFLDETQMHPGRVHSVIVHIGDTLSIPGVEFLYSFFEAIGLPLQVTNYFKGDLSADDHWFEQTQKFGVAISSMVKGDSAEVKVLAGFNEDMDTEMKLVVYLTEDSIQGADYAQANFFNADPTSPLFGLGEYIPDYRHDYVLRKVISTYVLGDIIPENYTRAGEKYLLTYSFIFPAHLNRNNLNVIAFITDGKILPTGFTNFGINVNAAKLGETKIWN